MSAQSERPTKRGVRSLLVNYPRLLPAIAFCLVLTFSLVSVFVIEKAAAHREVEWLNEIAGQKGSALTHGIGSTASLLRTGAVLLAEDGTLREQEFREFSEAILSDPENHGIKAIGWARFEQGSEASNAESTGVSQQLPIAFLHPESTTAQSLVGLNMYEMEAVDDAIEKASSTRRPVASGKVNLAIAEDAKTGHFIVVTPVLLNSGLTDAPDGLLFGILDAQEFFDVSLSQIDEGNSSSSQDFAVQLYDGSNASAPLMASSAVMPNAAFDVDRQISIADHAMTLSVHSDRRRILSEIGWFTLIAGVIAAALLAYILYLLGRQARDDIIALERLAEQNSIRNSLTLELNHRVKNNLANILSIISLTRRQTDDVDSFADGIDGRIRALSATHDLLTESEWRTVPLADVVTAELASYVDDGEHKISMSGPDLELAPKDALSLGLALHELTANASKFGSLSKPGGVLDITWSKIDASLGKLKWVESGGPEVAPSPNSGFGLSLVSKITAHELRHPVDLDFAPDGVQCTFLFSVRGQSDFDLREPRPRPSQG